MAHLGLNLPIGAMPANVDLSTMARIAEDAGVASLWAPDHIVQVREIDSHHPFSTGGRPAWPPDSPWPEVMTTVAWLAACTTRARVGSSVMVLPQRDPILVAKTAATIDALSGGRLMLGVGAGWMREEFEVLGWDFASRGRRMEEAMEVMRRCWTGAPEPLAGEFFTLPAGVMAYPVPAQPSGIPLLVGGMSKRAMRRAGSVGDGWLALLPLPPMDDDELSGVVDRLKAMLEVVHGARAPGRPPMRNVIALGRVEDRHLELLAPIARLGFDDVVINMAWDDLAVVNDRLSAAQSALVGG